MTDDRDDRRLAREFLAAQFGADAPSELTLLAQYPGGELEREGAVSIYGFRASRAGGPPEDFFTVVGQTQPNYYPARALKPDQMYSVHLGTRFMLVMEVGQVPIEEAEGGPARWEAQVRALLGNSAPGEEVAGFRAVAAFLVRDEVHAICRVGVANEDVYVVAGDVPPGIYRYTQLPPHVVYRLHLGNLIRNERENDNATEE